MMLYMRGQALAEGVVLMSALLLLWVLSGWVLRLQDVALQASHASRFAAFDLARNPGLSEGQEKTVGEPFFGGTGQRWADLRARQWLSNAKDVRLNTFVGAALPNEAQPGAAVGQAPPLRAQWGLADTGLRQTVVSVYPKTGVDNQPARIQRESFIVVGAGHAQSDAHVVKRISASGLAWLNSVRNSSAQGRSVTRIVKPLDAAWNRPEPNFEWLSPWVSQIPQAHLQDYKKYNQGTQ